MGRSCERRDVIILGAGPAGSTAAIALARAGRRVLLIEKARFPRDKVCGGCLSGPATQRLGQLLAQGEPLPGVPTRRITFHFGRYRLVCRPAGATRLVLRRTLDTQLAVAAVSAGAEVRYGIAARLVRGPHAWEVVAGDNRWTADAVLVGTGLGGLVRKLGIRGRKVGHEMIGRQWAQAPMPPLPVLGCVEMHWLRGGYVGLATPVAETCIVALAADTRVVRGDTALRALRRLNPDARIWDVLSPGAATDRQARGSAGFPWLPGRLGIDNVLLIGDAAGYAEPYTGEGMGQAMDSAACAAEAVLSGSDVLANYTRRMRRRHNPRLRRVRLIRKVLSTSLVHRLASVYPVLPHAPLARLVERVHVQGAV